MWAMSYGSSTITFANMDPTLKNFREFLIAKDKKEWAL